MKQIHAPILSANEILPGVYLIWLAAPEIAAQARPGQFVMVRCSPGYDPLLRRPLSIHRVIRRGNHAQLALLFAVVGRGTHWLSRRRNGESLDLLGPLGSGFMLHPASQNLLLVAGGIGIAPLIPLAEEAISIGLSVTLLHGGKTADQIYPSHLLPPELKLIVATEDGSAGTKGLITDLLNDFIGGADQIFACGPISMYQTLSNLASKRELENKSIQVSLEVTMGCGLGVCYGCAIETRQGPKLVCQDGPVFELRDIVWQEMKQP